MVTYVEPASSKDLPQVTVDQQAAGTTVIAAAVAGKVTRLNLCLLVPDVDGTLAIKDSDGTAVTGVMAVKAGVPYGWGTQYGASAPVSPAGKGLSIVTTTCKVAGICKYSQV